MTVIFFTNVVISAVLVDIKPLWWRLWW